jgi:hypothetical protein
MDEHVLRAAIRRDEAEALFGIEPFTVPCVILFTSFFLLE